MRVPVFQDTRKHLLIRDRSGCMRLVSSSQSSSVLSLLSRGRVAMVVICLSRQPVGRASHPLIRGRVIRLDNTDRDQSMDSSTTTSQTSDNISASPSPNPPSRTSDSNHRNPSQHLPATQFMRDATRPHARNTRRPSRRFKTRMRRNLCQTYPPALTRIV